MSPKIKINDKVKTIYGKIETVIAVHELQIFTRENKSGWYHPTKVWKA
jgi:hypothetical protein